MHESVIYKLDLESKKDIEKPELSFQIVHWKPSFKFPLRATRFPVHYNLFWLFHYLGVFKNKHYSSVLIYDKELVVSALMIVPAYYRWPFMKKKDVQLIYVITHKEYQRKGLAKATIQYALNSLANTKEIESVWYVTTTDNIASQKLCEQQGFSFVSNGIRKSKFNGFYKRLLLKTN